MPMTNIKLIREILDIIDSNKRVDWMYLAEDFGGWFATDDPLYWAALGREVQWRLSDTITRTITHPRPCSSPLHVGQRYYVACGSDRECEWEGDDYDMEYLRQGRIFLKEKDRDDYEQVIWGGVR